MIVVLDNLRSALNVGSILRTCEGLGIKKVFICGITPGVENEKVKKTALGAENNLSIKEFKSVVECLEEVRERGIPIYSLELTQNAKDIADFNPGKNFVLVVGNEVSGVSSEALELSNEHLKIEMKGKKESLNVAIAFGIAAFTLLKNSF